MMMLLIQQMTSQMITQVWISMKIALRIINEKNPTNIHAKPWIDNVIHLHIFRFSTSIYLCTFVFQFNNIEK